MRCFESLSEVCGLRGKYNSSHLQNDVLMSSFMRLVIVFICSSVKLVDCVYIVVL